MRNLSVWALLALSTLPAQGWAQLQVENPPASLVYLTSLSGEPIEQVDDQPIAENQKVSDSSSSTEQEIVRERYDNGRVHIERSVAMSSKGDFVNHGVYREFSPTGDVNVEGSYQWGTPTGTWVKHLDVNESKKVQAQLGISSFKPPFVSTVDFVDGKMNNMWTIADHDGKTVLQIELKNGLRHGVTTYFSSAGQIKSQINYKDGVLDGALLEKLDGKNALEETYENGRKIIEEIQKFPNGSIKSTYHYQSPVHRLGSLDNWSDSTLGKSVTEGNKILHGDFATHHDNGKVAIKGTYREGVLEGNYECWHRNGEVAIVGRYERGLQVGAWTWRHPNGMKEAVATFVGGKPQGKISAWDMTGKAISKPVTDKSLYPESRSAFNAKSAVPQ